MVEEELPLFLNDLDQKQKEAVTCISGPLMVLAGAGSGKTRVLTYRIAFLMHQGVDPFNILALTFTNKASKEMRKRIEKLVGPEARNLWMGTFHSVFAQILRMEAEKIGYPRNFTIYDTDDSKNLIKSIVKEMNLDDKMYKTSVVYNRISGVKNNLITAGEYVKIPELLAADESNGRPKLVDIFAEYSKRCYKSGVMDFDDLLLNTFRLLKENPDVLNKYQHKFKYVLVDEYQDTNHCQYMIIKKLVAVSRNICVVGDDSQSIYSFRGANIKNILHFTTDYPEHQVVKLEQNYRSSKTIVAASSDIISHNREKLDKNIWTSNPDGEKIKVLRAMTDNEEGKLVAQQIFEEKMKERAPNDHFAILYRTNAQSRAFEEGLRKMNIPYKIYGGLSFYQRKEVKDVIAYLRFIVNPGDEEALKRIINYPARAIGNTTLEKLVYIASEYDVTLWDVIEKAHHFHILGKAVSKLSDFQIMIINFRNFMKSHDAYEVTEYVVKQTGLMKLLHEDKTPEGVSKYDNLIELLNGVKDFVEDDTSESEKNLSSFLQEVSLLTDQDKKEDENADSVKLMTIHASKGLEFPYVFVVGLEENLFPSHMALQSRVDLEEERRLFYVASTRAEKKLTLTFANTRFKYGNLLYCEPSRFLKEIDPKYLDQSHQVSGKTPENRLNRDSIFDNYADRSGQKKQIYSIDKAHKENFFKSQPSANANDFVSDDLSKIENGMKISHQRFGKGVIVQVDGTGENKKAVIEFSTSGRKTIILKFAKMKIIS
jgi:DNA helicase II / ATP-dependent DNA helicase PcrA